MAKASGGSDRNLLWASVGLMACSFVAAVGVYYLCDFVLSSFQSSTAMAMIITDAGVKADDKQLEANLTSATLGLQACRDLGLALAIGCLGCGVAVGVRLFRERG